MTITTGREHNDTCDSSLRHENDAGSPRTKRTNTACIRCRERKVRCSGSMPCTNCVRRSVTCAFDPDDKKVLVSERYLNELKRKANGEDPHVANAPRKRRAVIHTDAGRGRGREGDSAGGSSDDEGTTWGAASHRAASHQRLPDQVEPTDGDGHALDSLKNPLVATPSRFVTDYQGRRRFLGPSSTWAYSRHVMYMIREYLSHHESPEVPMNVDGAAFSMRFPSSRQPGPFITVENLPSLDYALYLTNTVKFHLGQAYHLFEEQSFMQGLYALYNDGPQPMNPRSRLWYVQCLVIMAFGKALLSRGLSEVKPAGSDYFLRAIELFPDVHGLYQDPILSIEICCGLALYLQSVEHRNSAYVYLGLALRIALSQGIHRDLVGEFPNDGETSRCRSAWWTLYILDRKFSALMGAPSSIHDGDVTAPLPKPLQSVQKASALDLHVKLSRLIARVLNTVYGIDGRLDSSFLKSVQSISRELAALAPELNTAFDVKIDSPGPVSRISATLNLCYHQCVILATRPLLMCLLREKLERMAKAKSCDREMVEPVKALLKTSYDSANKSLRLLGTLQSQDLLEMFLPFDLENAFSAGFVLALLAAIQPSQDFDCSYAEKTLNILDALAAGGNVPARFRRDELERLHEMLRPVIQQSRSSHEGSHHLLGEPGPERTDTIIHGVSPDQMLTISSLLDCYPGVDLGPGTVMDDSWLWEAEASAIGSYRDNAETQQGD